MADQNNQGPMPEFINKGLGMLFGTKPKQPTGGMAPPPVATVTPAPPTNIFTPQKPLRVEQALRDAGVD